MAPTLKTALLAALAALGAVQPLPTDLASDVASPNPSAPRNAAAAAGGPVLLELFTSQGCSSCPPADALLARLAADPALGDRVVPLAFHVDYWNRLGWRDPFSDPRWSERQRAYTRALDAESVYTPMLVVDGRRHLVGSRERDVRAAVRVALAVRRRARLALSVGEPDGSRLPVSLEARVAPGGPERIEAWVALWEDGLVTPVRRGENADRTLRNDRVVRRLVRAAVWQGGDGLSHRARIGLELDRQWAGSVLGVAAFLTDPSTSEVLAAAAHPVR